MQRYKEVLMRNNHLSKCFEIKDPDFNFLIQNIVLAHTVFYVNHGYSDLKKPYLNFRRRILMEQSAHNYKEIIDELYTQGQGIEYILKNNL